MINLENWTAEEVRLTLLGEEVTIYKTDISTKYLEVWHNPKNHTKFYYRIINVALDMEGEDLIVRYPMEGNMLYCVFAKTILEAIEVDRVTKYCNKSHRDRERFRQKLVNGVTLNLAQLYS